MGFQSVESSLLREFAEVGLLFDIDRWDSEEELRCYQVGRSWISAIVTVPETVKHL